jgi:Domain of unknown function (DUF4440)
MKKFLTIFFFLPLALFAQSSTEKELLDLSKKKFDWMVHRQFDSLASVLDERLQFVHSNGWTETKQELLEDIRIGKLNYQAIEIHSANVRVYPHTAFVNGTGKFQVTMNGNSIALELGYTEVYIQAQGRWLLASRHSNRMP